MGGWCDENWYVTTRYDEDWLSVLQPKKASCSDSHEIKSTADGKEFGSIILIQQFLGFLFILLVLYRSCSPTKVDAYRLVFMYIIGTIAFVLGLVYGPAHGGFQRLVAFGVLLHNLAEWFIISRIWQGEKFLSAMPAILYVSVFAICITLVPLPALFFIGMFQGACCDWVLVLSFFVMMRWFKETHKDKNAYFQAKFRYAAVGFSAALLHVLSIQPLFFGMALSYTSLVYISSTLVVPTFVLYVWFASSNHRRANLVNPQYGLTYEGYEIAKTKMKIRAREIELAGADGDGQNLMHRNKRAYSEIMTPLYRGGILSAQVYPETVQQTNGNTNSATGDVEMKERGGQTPDALGIDATAVDTPRVRVDDPRIDIYQHIIDHGFLHIGSDEARAYMKMIMIKVFVAGTSMSLFNSLLVFFSPCYIDLDIDCT